MDFVRNAAVDAFPAEVRARFDIVGFDPRRQLADRGVGELGDHAEADTDSGAALFSVNCTDLTTPPPEEFPAGAVALATVAPRFGVPTLALDLTCAVWPVPARNEPRPVSSPTAPPLVVIGVTR